MPSDTNDTDADADHDGAPLPTRAVILAAGKGTRMKSSLPKVLHPVGGRPMILHCIDAARAAGADAVHVVIGHGADSVAEVIGERAECKVQEQLLGTGHAVLAAEPAGTTDDRGQVLVLYGDMPLLTSATLQAVIAARAGAGAAISMLTAIVDNPRGFGRVVRDGAGAIAAIVEEIDCTPEQLRSRELNVGVYCFQAAWLWPALRALRPNARKGEYFLTDLVAAAVADGRRVVGVQADDPSELIGINTRVDLADAEAALRDRINRWHMLNGVTIADPAATYISHDAVIGRDTLILPNTHISGRTRIGEACRIGPNSLLEDAVIGNRVEIRQSVVRQSRVDDDTDVGPWSHLRNGAHVHNGVHIGNFGEVKNSVLMPGVKQGHFSYLGDATVGNNVNIGAGTITCNFDGRTKNPTVIGDDAFIGSDTLLVAPVRVGAGARTGAGAVVTRDVPDETTVVGVPARALKTGGT